MKKKFKFLFFYSLARGQTSKKPSTRFSVIGALKGFEIRITEGGELVPFGFPEIQYSRQGPDIAKQANIFFL